VPKRTRVTAWGIERFESGPKKRKRRSKHFGNVAVDRVPRGGQDDETGGRLLLRLGEGERKERRLQQGGKL